MHPDFNRSKHLLKHYLPHLKQVWNWKCVSICNSLKISNWLTLTLDTLYEDEINNYKFSISVIVLAYVIRIYSKNIIIDNGIIQSKSILISHKLSFFWYYTECFSSTKYFVWNALKDWIFMEKGNNRFHNQHHYFDNQGKGQHVGMMQT